MIPGDFIFIRKIYVTAGGLLGEDKTGKAFTFNETLPTKPRVESLQTQLDNEGFLHCVYLKKKSGRKFISDDVNNVKPLINYFLKYRRRIPSVFFKRWIQIARFPDKTTVIPGPTGHPLVCFNDTTQQGWVIPGRIDENIAALDKIPAVVCPSPFPKRINVYRCAFFPISSVQKQTVIFPGTDGIVESKQCTFYLHGFTNGQKLHDHLTRHVIKDFAPWAGKLKKSFTNKCRKRLKQFNCQENGCRCDITTFATVHEKAFGNILNSFYREMVIFFKETPTKEIRRSKWSPYDYKIILYEPHDPSTNKKRYKLLVFNGTCLDWESEEPTFHLALASFYFRKSNSPPFSNIVRQKYTIRGKIRDV